MRSGSFCIVGLCLLLAIRKGRCLGLLLFLFSFGSLVEGGRRSSKIVISRSGYGLSFLSGGGGLAKCVEDA